MTNHGDIAISGHWEHVGKSRRYVVDSCRWDSSVATIGHLDDFAYNLDIYPEVGTLCEIGPYIAKVLDFDLLKGSVTLGKVDSPMMAVWSMFYPLRRAWQWLTVRFVYTLAIWGLAKYFDEGCYIGWYLVKERWLE
jgi:hypothetical protein